MIIPCRWVSEKVARGDFDEASWLARALVRFHLALCGHCAAFARQLRVIGEALRSLYGPSPELAGRSAALELRLLEKFAGK